MAQLITTGEILVEIMTTQIGQTFLTNGSLVGPFPSGAPAIMIDQAARTGVSCAIIACIGNDDFGKLNRDRLQQDGVDVRGIVEKQNETTGCAFVGYAADGSRKFIYHFSKAAAGSLEPREINESLFEDVKIFHVMGCSLSASASLCDSVIHSAKLAKARGALLSFDPNIRPELLNNGYVRDAFDWVLNNCDIMLTGKSELTEICGRELDEAISFFSDRYALVIKDGSRGARIITRDMDETIPSFKVEEVDPTGAGDCFDGAFLAQLIMGKSLQEAAHFANAAGALSVTKKGPMEGAAWSADVESFISAAKA